MDHQPSSNLEATSAPSVAIFYDGSAGPKTRDVDDIAGRLDTDVIPVGDRQRLQEIVVNNIDKRIIVIGGDGSVHQLLNAAQTTGTLRQLRFAVVPAGTGNDFARNIALPKNRQACVDLARYGREQPMDVIVDETQQVVVNSTHVGLGSVAVDRGARLKPFVGKLSYSIGGFIAGLSRKTWDVECTVDGAVIALPTKAKGALMAVVANGSYDGGGLQTTPGADNSDGQINLMLAAPGSLPHKLAFSAALFRGRHHWRADCQVFAGQQIVVRGHRLNWNDDGEPLLPSDVRTFVVVPAAVRVVRPSATQERSR